MKRTIGIEVLCLAALLVGCGGNGAVDDAGSPDTGRAVRAAAIADAIARRPDDAEAVLAEHDMTLEEFEALLYEISMDPALSRAYQDAREVAAPR